MAPFETRDDATDPRLRPLRFAVRREEVFAEARTMVEDLAHWRLVRADEAELRLDCERAGGLLRAAARVTIRVEGPDGMPSSTVYVRVESCGGVLARDTSAAREFLEPFSRRVG
jgi:hypothetical protein